jgi:hypothetical protein
MSEARRDAPRTVWSALLARARQVLQRPLLLNVRSVLLRIPFQPLDVNCLYFLEYVGLPPQPAHVRRGRAEVRSATPQDLEGLAWCQDKQPAFRNRFRANDQCAVAVIDGRVVGYQWFCERPVYVEERYACRIALPPDAVYEYDIFILPEHRLAGLWFKFHCLYLRDLMERRDRRRVVGMVDYGMRLSMTTHLRFGFTLFHRIVVIKMFGITISIGKDLRGDKAGLPRWIWSGDGPRADAKGTEAAPPSSVVGSVSSAGR